MSDITVEVVNPGITVSSTQAGINIALNSGKDGDPGIGVPVGGTVGQVLSKKTIADFDTEWVDQTGGSGGTSDHGDLTGLSDDDHPQYLTVGRGDNRYSLIGHNHTQYLVVDDISAGSNVTLNKTGNSIVINATSSGGVTDHGALTGLADDDHPQYLNQSRGDGRYSLTTHNHSGVYEPAGAVSTHVANADPHTQYLDVSDIVAGTNITLDKVGNVVTINSSGGGSGIPPTIIDAKGDILAGTANDTVARLGIGTNGQILTVDTTQSTGIKWANPPAGGGIPNTIVDAKGDLLIGSVDNEVGRLPVGTDTQVLVADAASPLGVKWGTVASGGSSTLDGLTDVDTAAAADGDILTFDISGTPIWIGTPTAVTSSGEYLSNIDDNVWDNNASTYWNTGDLADGVPAWNAADFGTAKAVSSFYLKSGDVARDWYLYGSNNGSTWTLIGGPYSASTVGTTYSLGATHTYRHFKFQTAVDNGEWTDPQSFTLYAPPAATWVPAAPVGGITVVQHGTNGATARPTSPVVYWVGTATPVNALTYDLWKDI